MPLAFSADQLAAADAVRAWARRAGPVATVRAQEADPSAWHEHWPALAALGLFGAGIATDAGGAGGTVADLLALVASAAYELAPGPVPGTVLAAQLVAHSGAGGELLAGLVAGERPVGLGLAPIAATERGGEWVLAGTAPVLGGDDDTAVVVPIGADRWALLDADAVSTVHVNGADLSRSAGTVHVNGAAVPSGRVFRDGDALLAALFAAEAAGVAGWCLHTAVEYAKVREQFGRPIGSFQAVQQLCAQMLCRVHLADAVAADAGAAASDPQERELAAAVAAAVALDAAVETAKDCIQVLGGIGFTWEHDAHLYLRRALSLRQAAGGTARWRRRVAELTRDGARRTIGIDLGEREAGRAAIRAQAERIAARPAAHQRDALVDAGYLAPHWPAPYGRGADAAEQLLIDQELRRAAVSRPDLVIAAWAVPTILAYGTPQQIDRFVSPTLRGDLVWCQLFSEPGAGSDLAALRTRAVRVAGGWRLSGQKVWTSSARQADWAICLARTNPDVAKHAGISYFLVDMTSPGLDVRPLREITGEALFNEVFLDDVFVPDDLLVGEVDGGWALARATLANERVAMGGGSSMGDAVERLVAHVGATDDPVVLDRLGALIAEGIACSLLDLRATVRQLDGRGPGAESSVRKLVGVRHRQDVAEAALDLLGPDGITASPQLQEFLLTRCLSIAGGTTQVLLSLAAQRVLGLPRH